MYENTPQNVPKSTPKNTKTLSETPNQGSENEFKKIIQKDCPNFRPRADCPPPPLPPETAEGS